MGRPPSSPSSHDLSRLHARCARSRRHGGDGGGRSSGGKSSPAIVCTSEAAAAGGGASPAALAPPLLGRADGGSGIAGGAGRGWLLGVGLRSAAATMSLSSDEKLARLARQRAACRECKVGHQSVSKRCQLCVLSIEVEV